MKKTEESLRKLKKGKKSTFSLFGGSSSAKEDESRADEEKIRTQIILDLEAFRKEAESLGVAVSENETFKTLDAMAREPLTEGGSQFASITLSQLKTFPLQIRDGDAIFIQQ